MKLNTVFIILAALTSVLISIFAACNNGDLVMNPGPSLELEESTSTEFFLYLKTTEDDYSQLSGYLNDIESAYNKLDEFKWQGLDDLGFWEIQQAGAACQCYDRIYSKDESVEVFSADAKWISVNTMIPSSERIKPISISLNSCRKTAEKMQPVAFYNKQVEAGILDDDDNIKEWLVLCKSLDSSLKSAIYQASTIDKTSNFNSIFEAFGQASDTTRSQYLDKFTGQSEQYSRLLKVFIDSLNLAESTTANLINETMDLR